MNTLDPQLRVFQAIENYWKQYHCPPSIRAICSMTKINSTSYVRSVLARLEEDGLILARKERLCGQIVPVWVKDAIDRAKRVAQ